VIGVNPNRLESDLQPMPEDLQQLWAGSAGQDAAAEVQTARTGPAAVQTQPVSMWWWVMLLALLVALAETALASGYMGTQREDA
jgi:hypothetical protein